MSVEEDRLTPEAFLEEGEIAKVEGFDVIVADEFTLLLDIDQSDFNLMDSPVYDKIDDLYLVKSIEKWTSKGGNLHFKVVLDTRLTAEQRLILEVALGSDPIRAVLSLARYRNGVEEPSRLFKPNKERQQKIADEMFAEDPF